MNQEEEIWKSIIGYEGLYEVSNVGRVRSIDRIVFQQGRNQKYRGKIMSPYLNNTGYFCVRLSKNNKKRTFTIHRLVATAFIPNPNNYPCVNHKDETPKNNNVENLEWCTNEYNVNYGTATFRRAVKMGKRVAQYDKNGKLVATFYSVNEAERGTNIKIGDAVKNSNHTAGGFFWRFYESQVPDAITVSFAKNHAKSVLQYSKNLELVSSYKSGREASLKTGLKHENILSCCRKKQKTCGGFVWAFEGCPPVKPTAHKNQKTIVMLSLDDEIIMVFDSVASASLYLGGNKNPGIKQCLYGKNKTAYGYKWRYANG